MQKAAQIVQVAPRIWLGSEEAAQQKETLLNCVKHVLIVGMKPAFPELFEYRTHAALDVETEDLLSHFDDLVSWIMQRQAGGVLIHCAHGVSRSVTVAVAYVMKTEKLDDQQALDRIKKVYPAAAPNSAFLEQLALYGQMGASLQPQHKPYKAFLLARQADFITNTGVAPASALSSSGGAAGAAGVTALHTADLDLGVVAPGLTVYACRACRKRLFLSDAIVAHEKGKALFERKHGAFRNAQNECTSHFIETYTWMGDLSSIEGKLMCPKCAARLGSYNWAGMQCSCGTWMRPAFQIVMSKVDAIGLVNLPPHTKH